MGNDDYQITPIEMTVTLIAMLVGVGSLTLPRVLAVSVGTTDGWISLLLGTLIAMILVCLIVRLNKALNGETVIT
ncbi:MAG: spore germination protein [Bacillaceae bacterium]|nr:spore germination protein [Bacillaceae bacterium]